MLTVAKREAPRAKARADQRINRLCPADITDQERERLAMALERRVPRITHLARIVGISSGCVDPESALPSVDALLDTCSELLREALKILRR